MSAVSGSPVINCGSAADRGAFRAEPRCPAGSGADTGKELTIKRLLTAAIALPLLILLILKGGVTGFTWFIAVVAAFGMDEFYRMALPDRRPEGAVLSLFGVLIPVLSGAGDSSLFPVTMTLPVLVAALLLLFRFRDIRQAAQEWAILAAGLLYVPLLLVHLVWLRAETHGISWIFLMLVIVMAGDSAAYYVGSALGRVKLYPQVSPNKSVEGALGGLAGSVAGALVARMTFFPELGVADAVVAALVLGVLGQLGDLFESLLKRSCGVKDSGTLVPGHGGILDRLDSILFAAPAAYWYAHFVFPLG